MAHKADVVIYTISTNISRIPTDGDKVLRYFAEETGGLAFFPFKAQDLAQSFENIANELRHQYNLFYRPEPLKTDGLYHTVDIRVKGARTCWCAPAMATTRRSCRGCGESCATAPFSRGSVLVTPDTSLFRLRFAQTECRCAASATSCS